MSESKPSESLPENSIIPKQSNYKDYNDFVIKHTVQKGASKTITNTRIGDKNSNIYSGSYSIPDAEYSTFLSLYYRDVILPKKKEYFTEKQRDSDGPILVDLDFRHDYDIDERQYTVDHIEDLVDAYLDELNQIYQFGDDTSFSVFVLEKPGVNRIKEDNKTKDGIHLIITLQADRVVQLYLRERIIEKVKEMWDGFPTKNTWEDVFDAGITKGYSNWQLYGSRKPNHDRYQLTHVYDIKIDPADKEIQREEIPLSQFNLPANFQRLSARYSGHPSLFMKNDFIQKYEQYKKTNNLGDAGGGKSNTISISAPRLNRGLEMMFDNSAALSQIRTAEELSYVLNQFLDSVSDSHTEYELKSTYEYVMILPATYYEDGSYSKWIRVGWCLKNTSSKLLIVWLAFSAKAASFKYSSIPDLCEMWRKFDLKIHGGLTKLSLIHWVKTDVPDQYENIRRNTIDFYVERTIKSTSKKDSDRNGCGDFDLANVLYQLYKHEFVCVSVKANIWYQYKNNRWKEIDSGTTLRKAISVQLRDLYNQKTIGSMDTITNNGTPPTEEESVKPRSIRILNICQRLANTNDKKNIMTEAKELFYDGTFLAKLNTNPYLLCFKNGVIDFKEKVFRKGHPEDNISICTGINYVPLNPEIHKSTMSDINDFMNKLFPERELCQYMWDHLASTLIGTSTNQTFNMYIGIGSNGKSVLVNLMEKVLGEYKGDVPLTLVTDKRGKIGGLAPEIVQLKGRRYAVMQEPSKGDVINEGVMKQLTSGKDPIQGRAPYMPEAVSFIPQFKLVVTCNTLMGVKANDHGTWRRIRAVPFKALFTENPVIGDAEKPYQFKLDKYIDEKFEDWKEVFAAMLVARAFETNGIVKDCDIVMAKSNEYRQSQDYIAEFIQDRVSKDPAGKIKKMELNNEFSMWYAANHGGRGPSPKDLHEYMDKEFGRQRNQYWVGVKIRYDNGDYDQADSRTTDDDISANEL
jgi:P4 family phage/plasmid primase-like protien